MNCSWLDQGKKECGGSLWVVAYACPGCEFKGTLLLCTMHYTVYSFCAKEKILICSNCNNYISVLSREVDSELEEEYINDL